eukprot:741910-Rhodomonas_salina.2
MKVQRLERGDMLEEGSVGVTEAVTDADIVSQVRGGAGVQAARQGACGPANERVRLRAVS